jgi:hypothetical protein
VESVGLCAHSTQSAAQLQGRKAASLRQARAAQPRGGSGPSRWVMPAGVVQHQPPPSLAGSSLARSCR